MGSQEEHIKIVLGADVSTAEKAMIGFVDRTKTIFHGLQHSIGEYFNDTTKGFLGARGLERAADFIKEKISEVFQDVKKMKAESEATGTSTKFIQDIHNVGMTAAISGEKIGGMLEKFTKFVPIGSDVEDEFYKTADAIAAIPDPSERARIAVEAFGKTGVSLVPILQMGSKGIKELSKSFSTLSEQEIESIEKAGFAIEQAENQIKVFVGKGIAGSDKFISRFGDATKLLGFWKTMRLSLKSAFTGEDDPELVNAVLGPEKNREHDTKRAQALYTQRKLAADLAGQYVQLMDTQQQIAKQEEFERAGLLEKQKIVQDNVDAAQKELDFTKEREKKAEEFASKQKDEVERAKAENALKAIQIDLLGKELKMHDARNQLLSITENINKAIADSDREKASAYQQFNDHFKRTLNEAAASGDPSAIKAKGYLQSAEQKRLSGDSSGARLDSLRASLIQSGNYTEDLFHFNQFENNANNPNLSKGLRDYNRNRADQLRENIKGLKDSEIKNTPFNALESKMDAIDKKLAGVLKVEPLVAAAAKK